MTIELYQIFPELPNWIDGVTMKYGMVTAVFTSQRYFEQRKALRNCPVRTQTFSLLLDTDAPRVLNHLLASLQKIMYVPIVTEKLRSLSEGVVTTVDTEDFTDYPNMVSSTLVQYVGFYSISKSCLPGISLITARPTNSSVSFEECGWDFSKTDTVIFPMLKAVLSSVRKTFDSAKLATYALTFDEYVDGSQV